MLSEATKLDWIETESEIEALIKEAELIKKYRPKYNYLMRDDKSYFFVGVTREKFPRIFITHQPKNLQTANFIGPFTNGGALKSTLRLLRKVFPYCTCRKPHKRLCLNTEIGRCLGCCCLKQNVATNKRSLVSCNLRYRGNIRGLTLILCGKKQNLLADFKKQMREAARREDFEKAAKLRDQVAGVENVFAHRWVLENKLHGWYLDWRKVEENIQKLLGINKKISRVEGYDISNISGKEATGSMVVFINGRPVKSEYRKFKIKTVHQINDVGMLREVVQRRLKHAEWSYPDLMLIDGGRPQLNAVITALKFSVFSFQFSKPFVTALAKREEELYTENRAQPIKLSTLPSETAFFFQRIRDEAHRFAKKYHHKLREVSYRAPR